MRHWRITSKPHSRGILRAPTFPPIPADPKAVEAARKAQELRDGIDKERQTINAASNDSIVVHRGDGIGNKHGSADVKKLQEALGIDTDGQFGKNTAKALEAVAKEMHKHGIDINTKDGVSPSEIKLIDNFTHKQGHGKDTGRHGQGH